MSGTFSIDRFDLENLLKAVSPAVSTIKEDSGHKGLYMTTSIDGGQLVAVGTTPGTIVASYQIPFSGTFNDPVMIPKSQFAQIKSLLASAKASEFEEINVNVSNGRMTFSAGPNEAAVLADDPFDFEIHKVEKILRGDSSEDEVLAVEMGETLEDPLPAGKRVNAGFKTEKIIAAIANGLKIDISRIPVAHPASWVMLDSPADPNFLGAFQGATYPKDYEVDSPWNDSPLG